MLGLIFITSSLFSQESLIKKDNSVMKVKILEIQENSIKYKPIEFLEGPVRSISLSEVSHIVYEDGKIETFNDLSPQPTSEESSSYIPRSTYSKIDLFARISGQTWEDEDLSDFFGTNFSLGAGLEKQLLTHLKIGTSFDFASMSEDEVTLNYLQVGGFAKFSWGDFQESSFLIYTEMGPKAVFIKESEYGDSINESGFGFSVALGLYIRLSPKAILDLRWDTTWATVNLSGYKLKTNNNLFSLGILFSM
jgi:hypothetical protein